MKYRIKNRINKFDGSIISVDIDFEPENLALSACITQLKVIHFPKFISYQSLSKTYGEEYVYIMNNVDMDWEDKAWAKSIKDSVLKDDEMFLVYYVMGEAIIKESIFNKILFDDASKVLEVYHDDKSLPDTWSRDMSNALESLKNKMQ
ncbi:hypothetical protein QWZ06_15650 [Chryseobacterium tructae]|uniref:DUF695 domain-containing protein n=1 Tax=Chryseobacterium tructae TaxID=1037380 RepID=A0ABV7XY07_9FLAO|nr:hypothetical protein [Chryseobacterium tructae]MDN3693620.1 hypothetical protein [Chryseobacterium tructae]